MANMYLERSKQLEQLSDFENTLLCLYTSDLSNAAYLAQDIPPSLYGEHPAAVQTGRRAISREALGS